MKVVLALLMLIMTPPRIVPCTDPNAVLFCIDCGPAHDQKLCVDRRATYKD